MRLLAMKKGRAAGRVVGASGARRLSPEWMHLLMVGSLLMLIACGGNDERQQAAEAASEKPLTSTAHDGKDAAALEYAREHYPSREVMLRVRACTEGKTEYRFPPLPDDYGPHLLTSGDPALTEAARSAPKEVPLAFAECVFELGVEDSFYPPDEQQRIRTALDPEN